MRDRKSHSLLRGAAGVAVLALAASACRWVILPKGEPLERAKARQATGAFAVPVNKRPLPDLSTTATLPAVLEYAFNNNGTIEQAYYEWIAAIERVPQAGSLSNPRLNFGYMFNAESVKSFSGALGGIRLMLEQEIPGRGKRKTRGEGALYEAIAAGERFRAAKFRLQKDVVQAYAGIALTDSLVRETSETLRLLRQANEVSLHRFHAIKEDGPETALLDLRKIEVEIQTVESEQRALLIERSKAVAELASFCGANTPIGRVSIPAIRMPSLSDADLFAKAVAHNPELAALRKDVEARGAAQVLAELEKRPDYTVGGGLEQLGLALNLGMSLPLNRARIRAGIAEALAMRQAAEARLRQESANTLARAVISLAGIRDAERILNDYGEGIVPKARELLQTQMTTYGSGGGDILSILDTERMLVEFRKMLVRAEADRLRFLAELEQVLGEDLFTFLPASHPVQDDKP